MKAIDVYEIGGWRTHVVKKWMMAVVYQGKIIVCTYV
jgi:hypothetical protein